MNTYEEEVHLAEIDANFMVPDEHFKAFTVEEVSTDGYPWPVSGDHLTRYGAKRLAIRRWAVERAPSVDTDELHGNVRPVEDHKVGFTGRLD